MSHVAASRAANFITTQEETSLATLKKNVQPNATQSNSSPSAITTVSFDPWIFIDQELEFKINDIYKLSFTGNRASNF